ncbi:uncharacterized protein LOC132311905 [Cornus florida]|uniref:uncharacterized protein LOC132311905 n=1 Tax=Cornus florida TaxID=4283 RepID=UPI0028A07CCF|nr:uncharacterized protein LOC132311905 [Cornus florida]XP_059666037.1 uncharacterized protein LOC132311905 [Cornus florida]XP_059666038.1 uncharacterized protein LOC132311905 [Cornus florida]
MMDRNSHTNEKQPLDDLSSANEAKKSTETSVSASLFVNHAEIAWQESRRKWIGDQTQKSGRVPKDPIISWSMTYEGLLSTNKPFPEPIPLAEMVDFLVDIWHDDGLYD